MEPREPDRQPPHGEATRSEYPHEEHRAAGWGGGAGRCPPCTPWRSSMRLSFCNAVVVVVVVTANGSASY